MIVSRANQEPDKESGGGSARRVLEQNVLINEIT